jgi:hypothetical protein
MAPRKTLILHVGMGKTGTTAIQRAFWTNRAILSRAGIAYPEIGAIATAHHLISPYVPPHLVDLHGWNPLAPVDWINRVAALPEPVVVMSSELISSASPDQVVAFCAALLPVFDLRLLLYLRRQDDMIAATYAQAVKVGIKRPPLSMMLDSEPELLDYALRLAPWEAALGRNRIIVRPYERSQFHQGDLIRDVMLHLGVPDLPPDFVHDPAATANARLSIPATEFKRLVNEFIPDRRHTQGFIAPLSACPPDPMEAHLIGRADRARIIASYADSNAFVARHYMNRPAGDLFNDQLPPNAPETAPNIGTEDLRAVVEVLSREAVELLLDLALRIASGTPPDIPDPGRAKIAANRLRPALDPILLMSHSLTALQQARAENTRLLHEGLLQTRHHEIAIAGHARRLEELQRELQEARIQTRRNEISIAGYARRLEEMRNRLQSTRVTWTLPGLRRRTIRYWLRLRPGRPDRER